MMMVFHCSKLCRTEKDTVTYLITRDGQQFGPYSLTEVQRYVGTGNILLSDLAQAEGSTEWIPVSQVTGTIAVQSPQQPPAGYAYTAQFPDPPDMNWGIVLLLDVVTCGIFNIAWNLVQAFWIKKVQPETKALTYYFVILGLTVVSICISVARMFVLMKMKGMVQHGITPIVGFSFLVTTASLVMNWIVYPFAMRASLLKHFNEVDPIGLQLNGVMTFFFGSLYFQYHLNRITELKRAYRPYGV